MAYSVHQFGFAVALAPVDFLNYREGGPVQPFYDGDQ